MLNTNNLSGKLSGLRNNIAPHWWKDPGLLRLHGILLAYFMCYITSGFDNSLLNNLQSLSSFLGAVGNPNSSSLGVISAISSIGAVVGAWPSAYVSDRFGRRAALLYGSSIAVAGIFVQTFSYSAVQYGAGRFIVGFGNMAVSSSGAAYVNEISHPQYRIAMTPYFQVLWYIGALVASWACYGTALHMTGSWQWRLPTLLQVCFAAWTFCLIFWTPESPRWLMSKGRTEEAAAILFKYHANGDMQDEYVIAEINEIAQTIEAARINNGEMTWVKAFKGKANRRRMGIVALFATSIAWTSQGIVTYYNPQILKQAGITSTLQQLEFNGGLDIVELVCAIFGSTLSIYVGRRKMLLTGFGGMALAHIAVTVCASQYAKSGNNQLGYAVIGFIWTESAFYNIGLNPVYFAYVAEIMSGALRAKGLVWFLVVSDLNGVVTRYVNPVGLANLKWWFFVVYAFFYVFWILGVYFFYPETRNKTLEEIEAEIDGREINVIVDTDLSATVNEVVLTANDAALMPLDEEKKL